MNYLQLDPRNSSLTVCMMQVPPCILAPFHQWSPALRVPRQKAPHLPLQSQQTKVQADVPKVSHLFVVTVNVCLVCELLSLKVNANSLLQGKLKQALSLPLDLLFPPAPLIPSSSQDPLRWTRRGASVSHQNPVGQRFVDFGVTRGFRYVVVHFANLHLRCHAGEERVSKAPRRGPAQPMDVD